jgi:hypothetical protein
LTATTIGYIIIVETCGSNAKFRPKLPSSMGPFLDVADLQWARRWILALRTYRRATLVDEHVNRTVAVISAWGGAPSAQGQ